MKTLICTFAAVAMLAFAAPSFAGPNTGQPSHAQRMMQVAQDRQETTRPYALTGEQQRAMHWRYQSSHVGAQRSHYVYVRCPMRHGDKR
ncbi:hypothetical protein HED60_12460 [Planctomycetales bacterium ZRK34]|nr:hypothetical protein HED60_12460 [Planctomycetales bacterium ZRK34]